MCNNHPSSRRQWWEVLEKHLEKNEKLFQSPEKQRDELEKQLHTWHGEFSENMRRLEKAIEELEKGLEKKKE